VDVFRPFADDASRQLHWLRFMSDLGSLHPPTAPLSLVLTFPLPTRHCSDRFTTLRSYPLPTVLPPSGAESGASHACGKPPPRVGHYHRRRDYLLFV